jgi:hypothetical protein
MRLDTERRNISIAGFLLCLLGIYAISPVDYFFRTNVGSRNRTVRTCRLDDHDHQDHALDAVSVISDALSNHGGDGGNSELPVYDAGAMAPLPPVVGMVPEYSFSRCRAVFLLTSLGRAPPFVS